MVTKGLLHVLLCTELKDIHYIFISITSKSRIKVVLDKSCGMWLQKFICIMEEVVESGSHLEDKLVFACIINQAMYLCVKCTNTKNMSQHIPEISSKDDGARQSIL